MKQCESIHMVVNLIEKQRKPKFPNKKDFAYHLDIHPGTYSKFLKGKATPDLPLFLQMCEAVGIVVFIVIKKKEDGKRDGR